MKCLEPTDKVKTSYDILMDAQMDLRRYIQKPIKSVEVLHEVLQWYHITEEQLFLYRNNQIKRVYMFLLHEVSFLNYEEIVEIVKCKNESEVIQGIEKIKERMRKDRYLLYEVAGIVERLKSLAEIYPEILDTNKR